MTMTCSPREHSNHNSTMGHHPPMPIPAAWQDLLADAGAPAVVGDPFSGKVVWANAGYAAVYGKGAAAEELPGRLLIDLTNDEAAAERLTICRDVIRSGKSRVVRDLWNGRAMCVTVRPMKPWDGAPSGAVVCVFRPVWPEQPGFDGICPSAHVVQTVDLGPLALLSKRELEVLALIGEGMTNAQIAARLHRTAKTIEAHRTSLAAKLRVTTREELAAVAARAGLGQTSVGPSTKLPARDRTESAKSN
jgi:DNA-binding CsgD family transcriptional regulator